MLCKHVLVTHEEPDRWFFARERGSGLSKFLLPQTVIDHYGMVLWERKGFGHANRH